MVRNNNVVNLSYLHINLRPIQLNMTLAGIRIVPFSMEYYEEIFVLWSTTKGIGLSEADEKAAIDAYIKRNPETSFLALSEGRVIGTILCGHDGRRGYIHHLTVIEECRRKGIARELIAAALHRLRKEGIGKCHLFVFNLNEVGRKFWKNNGWHYRDDLVVFSKSLT